MFKNFRIVHILVIFKVGLDLILLYFISFTFDRFYSVLIECNVKTANIVFKLLRDTDTVLFIEQEIHEEINVRVNTFTSVTSIYIF